MPASASRGRPCRSDESAGLTVAVELVQRLFQGIEHEVRAHGAAHPPAHDAPGVHVDDKGHEQPALPGAHVGEVRHPQLIGTISFELPVDTVERARGRGIWRGGSDAFAAPDPGQPELAHQPLDRTAGNGYAFSVHLLPDLVCAVDLPVGMPDPLNIGRQILITLGSGAMKFWIALAGSMQAVTRWGDLQNLAHLTCCLTQSLSV